MAIKLCPRPSIELEVWAFVIIGRLAGGNSAKNPIASHIIPRNVQVLEGIGRVLELPPFRLIGNGVQPH